MKPGIKLLSCCLSSVGSPKPRIERERKQEESEHHAREQRFE